MRKTNGQPDTSSQDESLTPGQIQQIIAAGERASQLLQNDTYNFAYRQAIDGIYQEWLETAPKEREKRESLYMEAQGVVNVTNRLHGLVTEALSLMQEQQERQSPEGVNADALDRQGFSGLNYQ